MSERGHAAVELAVAVGVLLLPVAVVVTSFGPWSERRVTAEAVAAEAARATVLALDHDAGVQVLTSATAEIGIAPHLIRAGWCGADPSPSTAGTCPLDRGSVVSITIEIWTPLVDTPWGPVGGLWVTAEHSEPIDLYRSLG